MKDYHLGSKTRRKHNYEITASSRMKGAKNTAKHVFQGGGKGLGRGGVGVWRDKAEYRLIKTQTRSHQGAKASRLFSDNPGAKFE